MAFDLFTKSEQKVNKKSNSMLLRHLAIFGCSCTKGILLYKPGRTLGPKSYKSLLNLSLNLSAIFEMATCIGKIFLFQIESL